jgi:hypothetical protein
MPIDYKTTPPVYRRMMAGGEKTMGAVDAQAMAEKNISELRRGVFAAPLELMLSRANVQFHTIFTVCT